MLVLTRKTKQQIQIGENIVVTILQVRGQTIRVGIEAPRDVRVVRSEIADVPVEKAEQQTIVGKASIRCLTGTNAQPANGDDGFTSPAADGMAPTRDSCGLRPLLLRRAASKRATTISNPAEVRR
jgi:carbon storage regulator CsrA